MLRSTPQIFGSLVLCSVLLSSVIVSFNYAFQNVTPSSLNQRQTQVLAEKTDFTSQKKIASLNHTIEFLRDTIQGLRDTIEGKDGAILVLQKENSRLNKQIKVLNNLMTSQRINLEESQEKTKSLEKSMVLLQKEILALENGKEVNLIERKGLLAEVENLQEKMDDERRTRNKAMAKIEMLTREKEKTSNDIIAYKKAKSIQQTTSVKFKNLLARNKKYGKNLKKIDKKKKPWNFTSIEFELVNANEDLILGKRFQVMVIDADTKKALPLQEVNPEFPDSNLNNKEMKFVYDGNLAEFYHSNYEEKEGVNFDVAVYFELNGELGLLSNGSVPFIRNGEVVFK